LLLVFAAAAVAPWLVARLPRASGWMLAALPAGLCAWYARQTSAVAGGQELREAFTWVPALGASLTFRLDGLSLLLALLITGIGAFVVLYASAYLEGHVLRGRFFAFLFLFAGAMLGVVLADNVIALFVFWELTSFSSYLLIGFDHQRPVVRERALQALLVTGTGGLALLPGLLLLGVVSGGGLDLSQMVVGAESVRAHHLYLPILGLIALAAFTKSAQVPFHFWLPNAMEAPIPVSAYLHAATMVKAGVYLLARLQPVLGGTEAWTTLLASVGGLTAVVGGVLALRQTDLKLLLAYTTISALGTLTMSLGSVAPGAAGAAMTFLLAHALYKGALFLAAGAIDHATGTREATALGGLGSALPLTAAGAALAGLSMAGVPFLFGFVGKELLYKAALGGGHPAAAAAVSMAVGVLAVGAAGIVVVRPFVGPRRPTPQAPHEAPLRMWLGVVALGGAGLWLGLAPGPLAGPIVGPAAAAVLGRPMPVHLAAWYGVDGAFVLSALTLALGAAGFVAWDRIRALLARTDALLARGPENWYGRCLAGLQWFAEAQTRAIQTGRLQFYLLVILCVLVALPGVTALRAGSLVPPSIPDAWSYGHALGAVITVAAVGAAVARSRIAALACVGVVGVGISVLFVLLGAPDLAMTQFLADVLLLVVALLVLRQLPRLQREERSSGWVRARDAGVALGIGTLVAALLIASSAGALDRTIPDFYARASVPEGFGRNVVNVILVDFRALDTLGEIIVLVVAAIGVHALVRFHRMPQTWTPPLVSLILRTATRFLFALLLLFSLFLLLRGHNAPGGGFIGGLTGAGAFALYLLAFGAESVRALVRVPPRLILGLGLLLALGGGLVALVVGQPLFTAQWVTLPVSGSEPLKVGTPLLFDVGVYLVVVGFLLTMSLDLEEA
jgi:multicomponent Na+:H+ antiporter subunit A